MSSLALKYRPFNFDAIVGQKSVSVVLKQMVLKESVPQAMLFEGPYGTGKTSTARVLGAALNCEVTPGPCGSCSSCRAVKQGSSIDVLEIDAASNGLVADIRELRDNLRFATGGRNRTVLIDEAQSISREGYNALLKILEEPSSDTTFVLVTTEPRRIPDTVLSRCMSFGFRKIGIGDMVGRLLFISGKENLDADESLINAIANRANGSMRDAIMLLDQVTRVGVRSQEQFLDLMGEVDFAPDMVCLMARNDLPGVLHSLDGQLRRTGDVEEISSSLIRCLREIVVLGAGGSVPVQGEALRLRQQLAQRIDVTKIVAALRVLWTLHTKVRVGEDRRSLLELACVVMTEQLGKGQPERRLSLAEIKAM